MKLNISTEGVPLAGTVQKDIEQRLDKDLERVLQHYLDDVKEANVRIIKKSRFGYKITFEMQLPGNKIYSEESNEDFHTALTILRDEVKKQILKDKEKKTKN